MFNPNEHMMQLKGRDYLQVMWRLVWFRDEKPAWSISTEIKEADADHAVFCATISDENGLVKSMGHGSESKKDFGDFLEKAETKAVGRALAMLGYGTQFAADELDEGERIVDSPVKRGTKEAAQSVGQKKLEEIKAKAESIKRMATPEQLDYITAMADKETYNNAVASFGENLERLTYNMALRLIDRIKGVGNG